MGVSPGGNVSRFFQEGADGAATNPSRAMQITVDIPQPLSGQSTTDLAARARLLLVVDEVRAERLTRSAGHTPSA